MKRITFVILTALLLAAAVFGQDFTKRFDAERMRERVKTLSDDSFEGRGPGTPGGKLATDYIAAQLKKSGVKPANKGSYFQNVKLVGVKADPDTKLEVRKGSEVSYYDFGDEFVATTGSQADSVTAEAELVFMGYGVDAPLFKWNDYSGPAEDYRGKILMIMVNDPPATTDEPGLFGGRALTYYGRWTYKYEEAARRGAAGVILIHTNESAGYGWNVVRSSNGGWRYEIAREVGDTTPFLPVRAWATNDAAAKMIASAGLDLDELRKKASVRGFKPVKTGLNVKLELNSELRTFESPNVVGIVEGSDKKLRDEYVIYTAHWDHLGVGEPNASGDKIYNGAYDNASGVSAVLAIADVFAKMKKNERPKRSILFLFPTAEEQGLLGTEYYATFPIFPLSRTAANVNIDGVNFFGKVSDFKPLGADRSSLLGVINEAAKERKMTVSPDDAPEQGFFFRSDHFPFAKVGVPAVSMQHGDKFLVPLTGEAKKFLENYTRDYYHQPSDEYFDWWDVSAMIQDAELGLAIGYKIANLPELPHYNETDEFSDADKKRFDKR